MAEMLLRIKLNKTIFVYLSLIFSLFLTGCGDPYQEKIKQQLPITEQRIVQLGEQLDANLVRNASLISQYADKVVAKRPELTDLVNEFRKDATQKGPMYLALLDRLNTVKQQPQMFETSEDLYEEMINLYQAADPVLFSDALSDPLNVLADMSNGELPRINALSKNQSLEANNAQDFGVGEQLIGNPSYGQWSTGSNGMSIWEWYGMYALMSNLSGSRQPYYSDWGNNRNYSYYNDYGRKRYSSPDQLTKQNGLDTRTRKSFESKGQKYTSAYSKNKTGASSLSNQSKTAQTSANRFSSKSTNKSQYANKSTTSKNGSFRNSSNNTTRGFRRGK